MSSSVPDGLGREHHRVLAGRRARSARPPRRPWPRPGAQIAAASRSSGGHRGRGGEAAAPVRGDADDLHEGVGRAVAPRRRRAVAIAVLDLARRPDAVRLEPAPAAPPRRPPPAPPRRGPDRARRSRRRSRGAPQARWAQGSRGMRPCRRPPPRPRPPRPRDRAHVAQRLVVDRVRGGAAHVPVSARRPARRSGRRLPWPASGAMRAKRSSSERSRVTRARLSGPAWCDGALRDLDARSRHADLHVAEARRRASVRDLHDLPGLALAAVEQRDKAPAPGPSRPRRSSARTRA